MLLLLGATALENTPAALPPEMPSRILQLESSQSLDSLSRNISSCTLSQVDLLNKSSEEDSLCEFSEDLPHPHSVPLPDAEDLPKLDQVPLPTASLNADKTREEPPPKDGSSFVANLFGVARPKRLKPHLK